jgi:thiamine pyrophosphate-dependent acetolactate synthase large subunit-like protein
MAPDKARLSDIPVRTNGQPFTQKSEDLKEGWVSDAIVEQLSRLDLKYIALLPGSSYRGIHDSLVNYKGNAAPEMLVTLHEEHAISIAHGYAKVTERPMAAAVHANVGLMHATMAIFNAFCDRIPIVILGATGPLDAAKRRPWIDWIHTAQDQGALIRPFVKFDDQPHSANAAIRSLVQATSMAIAKPSAPVYLCLDHALQEEKLDPATLQYPDTARYINDTPPGPSSDVVESSFQALSASKKPLFLFGRVTRTLESWNERIKLAELFSANVLTDLKQAAAFPTAHALHATAPGVFQSPQMSSTIQSADLIISFDWVDLAGSLQTAYPTSEPAAKIVHASLDSALHNGWSKDHFGPPPVDIPVSSDPDKFLSALLALATSHGTEPRNSDWPPKENPPAEPQSTSEDIFMGDLASAMYSAIPETTLCLVRVPLGWRGRDLDCTHPLSFLGQDGGAGLASGPGQAVGAGLALKNHPSGLIPVAILGDGDFFMGSSALWTAARYRVPTLVIVANNGSFFNDEVHQERVAKARGRPVQNKWIGMRLDDPLPDVTKNAESLGCATVYGGQVKRRSELEGVLRKAAEEVRKGGPVVVDVRVLPEGYSSALEKAK